jgi:DNA repair exonuclease SbcCD ATPase subunit
LLTIIEEREVKRANRELHNLTSKMDDLQKIETLQKRVTEHLTDVKRWERKSRKNQKRADELQKEKDQRTNELAKQTSMKQKLETLCRELQKENNKLKVCYTIRVCANDGVLIAWYRRRIETTRTLRKAVMNLGTRSISSYFGSCKIIKRKRIIRRRK